MEIKITLVIISLATFCSCQIDLDKVDKSRIKVVKEIKGSDTEVYTSMKDLQWFFNRERKYVDDIRAILDKKLVGQKAVVDLGAYISSYDDLVGDQLEDENFLKNPLNVYNLIRHVAVGWGLVENTLKEEKKQRDDIGARLPKRVKRVLSRRDDELIPGQKDLDGVATGIVRLHDYYRFNVSTFVDDGVIDIPGVYKTEPAQVTVWDIFKMAVKGTSSYIMGSGIEFMQAALDASVKGSIPQVPPFIPPIEKSLLKNLLKTAKTVHDQKLDQFGPRSALHSTRGFPFDRRLAKKKKYINQKPLEVKLLDQSIVEKRDEVEQFMDLCRGKDLRSQSVVKNLQCFYKDHGSPYHIIGPRKVEVVSNQPYIAKIHEFIMPSESEDLILAASPKLRRSQIISKNVNATNAQSESRISEQTWLTEWENQSADRLTKRIKSFIGLNTNSTEAAELWQVANYGISGQYTTHYDAVLLDKSKSNIQHREVFNIIHGDRIATIMGYLSDVEVGGYTVFPLVGAYVKPSKGSIVVWWNMDKNGGHDYRVRHGGCPVLIGSKWITNKWPRANDQMFNRKCPKYTLKQVRDFRNKKTFQMGGYFESLMN